MMLAITEYDGEITGCCPSIFVPTWEYALRHDSPDSDRLVIHQNTIELAPLNWFLAG